MLIIAASFLFGEDFYLRETPRVVTEKILTEEYRNITLNQINFLFAFRIEDKGGRLFDTDLFNITLEYYNYQKNSHSDFDEVYYSNNMAIPCDKLSYLDEKFFSGNKPMNIFVLIYKKIFLLVETGQVILFNTSL